MKTKVKSTPIIASKGMDSSIMSMDNKGKEMACFFLRDKIYSNKIQAVVREYICNAVDEHVKYNVDRPVEVNLTAQGLNGAIFSVRDFANGLSEDAVRKIFGCYFKSTKSETNESIGGFGVGSKAGHAYTDAFNIISYFDGVKTSYSCMLGAGESGGPVGHIYKMGEPPTDETGVEINLTVKEAEKDKERVFHNAQSDVSKFKYEIIRFIQFAHSPITAKIFDNVYDTPEQKHSVVIDGFTVAIVDAFTTGSNHYKRDVVNNTKICIKMGDVVYGSAFVPRGFGVSCKSHHFITITAPMGQIDIPISRENMEDTVRNRRVKEKIDKVLEKIINDDSQKFKKKTLIDLVDEYITSPSFGSSEDGNYFNYSNDVIYGLMDKVATSIRDTTTPELKTSVKNVDKENGKPVVVFVPNNRTTDKWISKVNAWCLSNDKKYLILTGREDILALDTKDSFHLIDARKLKISKKQDRTRAVIYYNGENWKTMSALEFHNHLREYYNLSEAKDEAQAKRQNAQLAKTGKDIEVLIGFILNPEKSRYSWNASPFYVGAKGLLKDLKDIGIAVNSPISIRKTTIQDENQEKNQQAVYSSNIQKMSWVSDRTKDIVKKHPDKSQRIVDLLESIRSEGSLRGKILTQFNADMKYCNAQQTNLSKSDMKKILNLV